MVNLSTIRKLALSFPQAEEKPHFEKASFRIGKKIFATLSAQDKTCAVKLSVVDQSVFCDFDSAVFYPASGAWGRQGYTIINLRKVRKDMLVDALTLSWKNVAPKKLHDLI